MVPSKLGMSDTVPQINPKERYCIYEALWHEARGESIEGIKAVLSVIQNRVYSGKYPSTYCKVIRQHKQFSYVHLMKKQGLSLVPQPTKLTQDIANDIRKIADDALHGKFKNVLPPDVLWYHTVDVNPKWNRKMQIVKVIGNHKFLRITGPI